MFLICVATVSVLPGTIPNAGIKDPALIRFENPVAATADSSGAIVIADNALSQVMYYGSFYLSL